MPNLSTLRSPFQGTSLAVTAYVISHKPLRIQVKHCLHGFLNQLLHKTATAASKNAFCQVWIQYLPLLGQRNEAVHEYFPLYTHSRAAIVVYHGVGRVNIVSSSCLSLGLSLIEVWIVH